MVHFCREFKSVVWPILNVFHSYVQAAYCALYGIIGIVIEHVILNIAPSMCVVSMNTWRGDKLAFLPPQLLLSHLTTTLFISMLTILISS